MKSKFEFLLSECEHSVNDQFILGGICNEGTIAIGDTFLGLVRDAERQVRQAGVVDLRVTRILAYRRDLAELPRGMSAELYCMGTCKVRLLNNDLLTS